MKSYTKKFKLKIVKEYINGKCCTVICNNYGISKSCLYDWLKLYKVRTNKKTKESFTYQQFMDLKRKYEKVATELEIIKQTHCFPDSPRREREIAIERLIGTFPISTMCHVLALPKGTFFNYHLRRVKVTQNQQRDEYLKQEILRVFNASGQRFGAPKIRDKLVIELGIEISKTKVSALMKAMNIKSRQCRKRSFNPEPGKLSFCKNRLHRQFNQDEPNKYWVSDVTELRVKRAKFYLCVIMDLFSRKIIAYRLSSQNNTALVINTFKDAYEKRNRPIGLTFHSDQGNNYVSEEFRDLLHSLKVKQSFSKKGNPYDNAVMESFFATFKREEYNASNFDYFEELVDSVNRYMTYYNSYRIHRNLHNLTPDQIEENYQKNKIAGLSD